MALNFNNRMVVFSCLTDRRLDCLMFNFQLKVILPVHAVTTLLGLMAMRLSSDPLLPLDFVTYAKELEVILVQSCATTDCTKSLELLISQSLCKFNVSK
jgi:hypothetical protein